jgi:hypothetical protein
MFFNENWQNFGEFMTALSVVTGAMSWWRKGSENDDKVYVQAADLILDSISDADKVNKIKDNTWNDLRDQLSIEEAEEMHEERELRRFGWGRN